MTLNSTATIIAETVLLRSHLTNLLNSAASEKVKLALNVVCRAKVRNNIRENCREVRLSDILYLNTIFLRKGQISPPFHILKLVKSLPFYTPETRKKNPFKRRLAIYSPLDYKEYLQAYPTAGCCFPARFHVTGSETKE